MANTPVRADGNNSNGRALSQTVERFIDFLNRRIAEDKTIDTFDLAADQLDRILNATDEAAMWAADDMDAMGGRNLEDIEMQLNSVVYRESNKYDRGIPLGNGMKAYIIVRAQRLDNGEEFGWNTGAPRIIGKVRWLEAMNYLGTEHARVVIRGKDVEEGRVLVLKPIPSRALAIAAEALIGPESGKEQKPEKPEK